MQRQLGAGGQVRDGAVTRVSLQHVAEQGQDVLTPLAQGAQADRHHGQAIVEVFAKATGGHLAAQVTVGGGDHPHVQVQRTPTTHSLHLAFLQHAQQLGLQRQGHLGDFIQQQGAALGLLELARVGLRGAGEGALLMAEQHGFEHRLGDGCTVDGNEGLLRAR